MIKDRDAECDHLQPLVDAERLGGRAGIENGIQEYFSAYCFSLWLPVSLAQLTI